MSDSRADIYRNLSPAELQQAQAVLERYFEVALDIAKESLGTDNGEIDTSESGGRIKERSNVNLKT